MKRILVSAILAIVFSQAAVGADFSAPSAAPSWTGFYLGVHAGWGWASNQSATDSLNVAGVPVAAPSSFILDNDSPIAGLQAGYNYQFARWLVGVEGDISGTRFSNSQTLSSTSLATVGTCVTGFSCGSSTMTENVQWLASARGRLGYIWGPGLFYVTGGVAWANVSYSGTIGNGFTSPIYGIFPTSSTSTQTGAVVGGGYEWMLSGNWLLRGEFLHYWFNQPPTAAVTGSAAGVTAVATYNWSRLDVNVARLGLTYKFD